MDPVSVRAAQWRAREGGSRASTPSRSRPLPAATAAAQAAPVAQANATPALLNRSVTPPRRPERRPPPLPALVSAQRVARTLKARVVASNLGNLSSQPPDHRISIEHADGEPRATMPGEPESIDEVDGLLGETSAGGGKPSVRQSCLATTPSLLVLLGLLAAVVMSVLWGFLADDACTSVRACAACAEEAACVWCPGPDPSMPGYCEELRLSSESSCTSRPTNDQCATEDQAERKWATCHSYNQVQCEVQSGCSWCDGATQRSCVPRNDSMSPSFCEPDALLFASLSSVALSQSSPACAEDAAGNTIAAMHLDRSEQLARESARRPETLAVNSSYVEGLKCAWVIECPFNTSVEVRITEVNMGSADTLRLFDGWDTDMAAALAYFKDFSGDRSGEFATHGRDYTSVTGGPSARLLLSSTPLLTLQLTTGGSEARKAYSRRHGRINFPSNERYTGFSLNYRCTVPPPAFTAGLGLLGLWWVLTLISLSLAFWRINYGAKSGGLWKMNLAELTSIADAMQLNADIDGDGDVDKSELIAAIIQSPQWPSQMGSGLALSSFETLSTDRDPATWLSVSWFSPHFILDVFSCVACGLEGFCDFLFVVLQFSRPNGGGHVTGSLSLVITVVSTLFHLAPPGRWFLSSTVLRDVWTFARTKAWVQKHARTETGERLRSFADWNEWLSSPAGKHRPPQVTSVPQIEFRGQTRLNRQLKSLCTCARRGQLGPAPGHHYQPSDEPAAWVSWDDFLGSEGGSGSRSTVVGASFDDQQHPSSGSTAQHARASLQTLSKYVGSGEESSGEPGWLCGVPPQNQWDSDAGQVVYGRVSTPLMYLLTLLQLRVPVEGMIAWRNVRTLKTRAQSHTGKACCRRSAYVREADFERARVDLDKALLREAIFECLPQAVLEFQNLWADEYAVLDLMSVPGVPFLTSISEYQLTFAIMCCTILTSTIDLTTPYGAASPLVKLALSASALVHLTSRLLVFGAVLSMEPEGKKTTRGTVAVVVFFLTSFVITCGINLLCTRKKLYHRGNAAFRVRTATSQLTIAIRTEASRGSGTTSRARLTLHGEGRAQSFEIGRLATSNDSELRFEPGSTRTFTVECPSLGPLVRLEISHDESGSSPSWHVQDVVVKQATAAGEKQWVFDVARWISRESGLRHTVSASTTGVEQDDQGLSIFNLGNTSHWEKVLLFSFINLFTCTDKNVTTAPTSRGTLILAFWRVVEAALVCVIFVPLFGAGVDSDGDGHLDRISAFQIKSFLAVYLSLASFACLLAAAAAERMVTTDIALARIKLSTLAQSVAADNTAFLGVFLLLMLLVTVFSGEILYEVYLQGDTGARRCRSIVLLSLMSATIVVFVCVRVAGGGTIRLFWERRSTPQWENWSALALLAMVVTMACVLGVGDGVDLRDDLDYNPFKMVTSRCHPAQEWRTEILRP